MKRTISVLLFLALTASLLCACRNEALPEHEPLSEEELSQIQNKPDSENKDQLNEETKPPVSKTTEVIILGDSTATWYHGAYKPDYLQKRNLMGWSRYFPYYFNQSVKMNSLAFGGASTLKFKESDQYNIFLSALSQGDFVLIQFAHNEVYNDGRRTMPNLLLEDVDESCKDANGFISYQAALYYYYLKPILDAGATPILITPTVLRNEKNGLAKLPDGHTDYIAAMQDIAQDLNIPCVEITTALIDLYQKTCDDHGAEATKSLHAYTDSTATALDKLHLSHTGAYTVAGLIATELQKTVPEFEQCALTTPREFDLKFY